jgi:hypothetical protein
MRRMVRFAQVAASLVLVSCANTTPVQPVQSSASPFDSAVFTGEIIELEKATPGAERFRVFQQGATGFVSLDSVRNAVEDIATRFCSRKGKALRPVRERRSRPPHVLGNFPRAELEFECADVPSATAPPAAGADRLSRLERLKRLLDSGALTQQEYEAEKAKILAAPR